MCGNASEPVIESHAKYLRIVAAVTLFIAFIQLGLDLAVFTALDNVKLGAFWAAADIIVAAFFCLFSSNRGLVITGCVFSVVGILMGLVGAIVDGIASGVFASLDTCIDRDGTVYGHATDVDDFFQQNHHFCRPAQHTYYGEYNDFDCGCFARNSQTCLFYSGPQVSTNCGYILTTYSNNIAAASAFDAFSLILVFLMTIIVCMVTCSRHRSVQPVPHQVQMIAVQAHTQPQQYISAPQQLGVYVGVPQQQVVYAQHPGMMYGNVAQQQQQQQQMYMNPPPGMQMQTGLAMQYHEPPPVMATAEIYYPKP